MSDLLDNPKPRMACIVPTYNGRNDLPRLLESIKKQSASFDVFIVDSSSSDGTDELARSCVQEIVTIPNTQFNHGGTRQQMVEKYLNYDIYVFMTQDAYLADKRSMERLVTPFSDPMVGAVCGRQLPHLDADVLAVHARFFNYPAESRLKSMADAAELGIKTPFVSNSFAAYRREALLDVGGFPKHVILSEDTYVAARMLLKGWKVAYAGDARCRHSHNYTMAEEFRRYFDTGVFHARESWVRESFGGAGGEGFRFVKSELRFLALRRWYLWPASLLRNTLKLLGYKLGRQERWLPLWVRRRLSMHSRFWDRQLS